MRGLERALEETDWTLRERRAHLLCLLVQAAVAQGDAQRAYTALQQLTADPETLATDALKAMHCGAQAELALHAGEFKPAAQKLRQAVRHWREVGSPVGEAEARLRLAECLLLDDDAAGSELELHTLDSNLLAAVGAHGVRLAALRQAVSRAAQR
jgi:hypothetical protein